MQGPSNRRRHQPNQLLSLSCFHLVFSLARIDSTPESNDVKEDDDIGASEDYKESDDNDKEMTIKKPMMTILSPKAPGRLPSYPLFMLPSITHYHYLIGPN